MASQEPVVRVDGLNQLARAFKDVDDKLDDLKAANAAAASLVLGKARARTPRKSGRLAASLRIGKGARSALVREGNNGRVPYAGPVEFGGYPKGREFVSEGRYLFPAAAESVEAVNAIYEAAVSKIADEF